MSKVWKGLVLVVILFVMAWSFGIFAEDVHLAGPIEEPMQHSTPNSSVSNPGNNQAGEKNPLNVVASAGPIEEPMQSAGPIEEPMQAGPIEEPMSEGPIEEPMEHNVDPNAPVTNPGNNQAGERNPLNAPQTPVSETGPIEEPMSH